MKCIHISQMLTLFSEGYLTFLWATLERNHAVTQRLIHSEIHFTLMSVSQHISTPTKCLWRPIRRSQSPELMWTQLALQSFNLKLLFSGKSSHQTSSLPALLTPAIPEQPSGFKTWAVPWVSQPSCVKEVPIYYLPLKRKKMFTPWKSWMQCISLKSVAQTCDLGICGLKNL